jgi:hypothetical protein
MTTEAVGGARVVGLLKQMQPRLAMIFGCCILALAGMSALLAWAGTVPPRGQLRWVTGQLQELELQNARAGVFRITLASEGAVHTFYLENAHRLVTLLSRRQIDGAETVAVAYYPFGRSTKVVDVTLGQDNVLSYEDVASLAAGEEVKKRNTAIGLAALGALMIFLGGAAWIARASSKEVVEPSQERTFDVLMWLFIYGAALVVILSRPETAHRAFGAEAFHLAIEYVVPVALALLFLPMSASFIDLVRRAICKGRWHQWGSVSEVGGAFRALWPLAYLILLCVSWAVYATIKGI